jgi:hypothetical protein
LGWKTHGHQFRLPARTPVASGSSAVPDEVARGLIWIAVRRIGRQKEQAQYPTQRLHESAGLLRPMSLAPIHDQEDFTPGALDQAFQEFNKDTGIDAALFNDHEPHVAARGDRRNQTHAMAGAGRLDDGRAA